MDTEQSIERQLLSQAQRQTELLAQINWVLWAFFALTLVGVVLFVVGIN